MSWEQQQPLKLFTVSFDSSDLEDCLGTYQDVVALLLFLQAVDLIRTWRKTDMKQILIRRPCKMKLHQGQFVGRLVVIHNKLI